MPDETATMVPPQAELPPVNAVPVPAKTAEPVGRQGENHVDVGTSLDQDIIRTKEEVRSVTEEILSRKALAINREVKAAGNDGRQLVSGDRGKGAIITLDMLKTKPDKLFDSGFSMDVAVDGQKVTVTKDNLTDIPQQAIIDAQLLEEKDVILGQFPEESPERSLLELHIKSLQGDDSVLSDAQAVETLVGQARESLEESKAQEQQAENAKAQAAEPSKEQSIEDAILTSQISSLEKQIAEKQKRGENTKNQERQLVALRVASTSHGEGSAFLKLQALKSLRESGIVVSDDIIKKLEPQAAEAKVKIVEFAKGKGMSDENIISMLKLIEGGDFDAIMVGIESGTIENMEGFDVLVFGKQLEKEDLEKLLDTQLTPEQKMKLLKKYGSAGGILVLLVLMFSVKNVMSASGLEQH